MLFNINNTVDVNVTGKALNQLMQAVNKLNIIINSLGLNNSRINLSTLLSNVKSSLESCEISGVEENKKLERISASIDKLLTYVEDRETQPGSRENSSLDDNTLDKILNSEYKVQSIAKCTEILDKVYQLLVSKLNESAGGYRSSNTSISTPKSANDSSVNDTDSSNKNNNSESLSRALSGNENKSSTNKSEEESLSRALENVSESENKSNFLLDQLSKIGKDTFELLKKNFMGIFDKWNSQIATLKEQGMGSSSAAQLNRMTKRTMNSTEDLLGFNISIDKAIKSTNDILGAGFSPAYMRENNKQLLVGLSAVGIKLENDTIREIGNQVFDATHVKELTGDLAKLVSPDSENRMDAAILSRAFNSQEFKTIVATATMQTGASKQDVEKRFAELLIQNKQYGRGDEESIERAYMDLQSTLGGGAYVHTSKNLQSMIALQQLANPNWDLRRDGLSSRFDIEAYNADAEYRKRVNQISPTIMLGGDNTAWNIQNNDGTIRKMATNQEIEEGQYEGFIPRITKGFAGLFNAESMGGVSQSLIGDSKFITNEAFDITGAVGSLLKSTISQSPQIMYLRQIAHNTGRGGAMQNAISGSAGGIEKGVNGVANQTKGLGANFKSFANSTAGKVAGSAGIVMTVADVATDIYAKVDEIGQSEKLQLDQQNKINHLDERSRKLQQQYNEALLSGNSKQIEETKKMLEKSEAQRNQNIKKQMELEAEAENASITAWSKGIGTTIGGTIGAIIGGPLGGMIGGEAGNLLGGGIGTIYGMFNGVNDQDAINEARRRRGARYSDGGIITKEHEALVGEGNKPEVVIPLTKPDRAEELMEKAANLPLTSPEVASMMENATGQSEGSSSTVADNVIAFARSQIGKPYSIYSDGFVCNTFVHSALKSAGLVKDWNLVNHNVSKWWTGEPRLHKVPLAEAKPGMIGFSNKSSKTGNPQHMGIISGDGKWVNASGSAVNGNYKKGEFVASPNSKGVVEATMNTKDSWGMVGAGYIDGMFNKTTLNSFTPTIDSTNPSGIVLENSALSSNRDISDISPSQQVYIPQGQYTKKPNPIEEYRKAIEKPKLKNDALNEELVGLLLESKLKESVSILDPLLYANNPFGLKGINGELLSFNSFEDGINTFIEKMEKQFAVLDGLDKFAQLDLLKMSGNISLMDYTRVISALDKLSSAVEESNRISNRNKVVPTSQIQKRTYVN